MTSSEHSDATVAVLARPKPPARLRLRTLRWIIAALIALAGLCYSSWVLEFVLPVGLNPVTSFLSELDAQGRPYRWVFATADTVTGALAVLAAIGGLVAFTRRPLSTVAWVALGCFGAATIADAQWPLRPCADCQADDGLFPQLRQVHALTSTLAVTSIFVAMIGFSVAAFRYRRWPILRHSGLWILVLGSVVTTWMLVADNLPGDYALGIAQRIQVGSMSLWLVALAVQIWVAERALSDDESAPPPATAAPRRRALRRRPSRRTPPA
ncbi:DUF998 domain-containing protein [Nocardia sp. CDC159]|uniref:DUF998 domain-containing protein n=1 Tax=Nocardia pulmonis TaxID=2951408 RepID=A0A9X2ED12_9NOCA|nr:MULTISPECIES: DUF998 domain-containing protein [Nocardia]MCM6778517.1 DUF998 domain-containing protein [Nocardia pulmonis]MCM6791406.1 DUF998 domain-containing protein [Nocardia sp. CDC159]